MTLDELVREASGRYSLSLERKDIDRGFYFIAKLEDDEGDRYKLDSLLSIYMDERASSRNDLTNDAVEQAAHNIIEKLREDHPDKRVTSIEIEERTLIRDIEVN